MGTKVLGRAQATAGQMAAYLLAVNPAPQVSMAVKDFCQLFLDTAAKEGVRGDALFAQSCKETGNFTFRGTVKPGQNNFAGLGTTDPATPGASFPDAATGILAQAQHAKAYATKGPLSCPCVDPRYGLLVKYGKAGTAQHWEELGGKWAVPGYDTKKYKSLQEANDAGDSYGYQVVKILDKVLGMPKKEGGTHVSNSPLVTHTNISPNKTSPRNHAIDTLTIHCFVGQVTAKRGCEVFRSKSRQASCNYVVGHDGSIGLCVEEKDRSWCSSNRANDMRAITFEVASDTKHPYAVTDKALSALIDLIVDICRRNGKTKVLWFADKDKTLAYDPKPDEMVMTVHRWFAAKACPGDYLYGKHGYVADEVNKRLGSAQGATATPSGPQEAPSYVTVRKRDTLSGIGRELGLDWREIAAANGLKHPYTIRVGQKLTLPCKASLPAYYPAYQGKAATLYSALTSLGIPAGYDSRQKIAAANGISAYANTARQNAQLYDLLVAGALKRA